MKLCLILLLAAIVLVTAGKKKSESRAALGYKECPEHKENYKNVAKKNKKMKWMKPKALSDICPGEHGCPAHEVLPSTGCGFGVREIGAGNWISTLVLDSEGDSKYEEAYKRLVFYLTGGNEDGTDMGLTVPLIVQTGLDENFEPVGSSMALYLPAEYQKTHPAPTGEDVEIEEWDDIVVYYRAFGYSKGKEVPEEIWDREFINLGESLTDSGLEYYWWKVITGSYSHQSEAEQRHEVMYIARRHDYYDYNGDDFSLAEAQGYEECEGFPETAKPKATEGICGSDAECPDVEEVENENCGFGVRNIKAGNWVSTEMVEEDGEQKWVNAFIRLFAYIYGENDEEAEIPMTIPVLTKTYMNRDFENTYSSMHFYLPSEYQDNPPTPTNELVEIEEWIDTKTYYRAIGDYGADADVMAIWKKEFKDLGKALSDAGENFYPYMAVTATFTRPGFGDQRHEAIFVSQDADEESE
ncbi:uncharacterized protein LOC134821275 [Bolinopsis microptera]|uniref:uncharacterized protein LOC134821275 n=1 Tax=Bolinopsis microptera TaxID=2820187 RepID=UPI00307B0088